VTTVSNLPPLPAAYSRALALMAQHDATIPEVAAVVESDPALTVAVLRAANAAANTAVRRIGTATDAIVRIGMLSTRRIIAGATLGQTFRDLDRAGLDTEELWRHLLATALLSDASAWPGGPRTESFTTGLLHDVGRLVMASSEPARYHEVVARVAGGEEAAAAERAVFGADHVEWGVEVASAWNFPDGIVDGIAGHHDGEGSALSWVTYNGRRIAQRLGMGDGLTHGTKPEALDEDGDDFAVVESLGGVAKLEQKIDWYHGIFTNA
jgi:putative nucleotidyltransferase with HDIG domain